MPRAGADNESVNPTTRFRSASLAARLLMLVVVPILAVTVLSVQRIDADQRAARQAESVVAVVELQRTIAAVYPYANLERIALEGLARIDELGVPRSLVVTISGVDLESAYSTNAAELDRTLDALADRYRSVDLGDGDTLGTELRQIRFDLQTQRTLSNERSASRADVETVFQNLSTLLERSLATTGLPADLPTDLSRSGFELTALSDVLVSAGEYGQLVVHKLVTPGDDATLAADRAYATHLAYLDVFEANVHPQHRDPLDDVRAVLAPFLDAVPTQPDGEATVGATDPSIIRASTDAVLNLFEYLSKLQEYSIEFHNEVAIEVSDAAHDAHTRADQSRWVLLAIAAFTLGLIVLTLWSILRPLRRLTARAADISRGELDLAPLPLRGPSDVRALAHTMNEMLATLHRVNSEITRLASGDVDTIGAPDLPGAIGVSMRDGVRHLTTVTAQLHRSEQLSSAIVTQAADAIWTVDAHGAIRTANEASGQLTRVPPHLQIGRPIREFLTQTSGEGTVTVPFGPTPKVLVATSVIEAGDEQVTAVIAHDISERTQFEERLTYQANHDALTGLPNRFAVLDRLEQLVADETDDVAVLFVDLDAFKSVNDTHGHAVGDKVLARMAATLTRCVRNGEFVGRLGGDEFVVIVRHFAQPADVIALGYRVIQELEQPQDHDGNVFVLSASVGVAIPVPGTPALDTIRQADNAVYQAKKRGRGRVELFDASMQALIEREAALELALRRAVRNGELVIHLQPVFDLATDRIMGAEALVRWNRPGHGLVPPNDFIPIAERTSLIFEVERWVLTEACERVASWRRRDPDCQYRIAVNISGRHLIEGDLLNDVEAALTLSGADPSMLELELTETQLLEDIERATAVLDALRARGITIAVDDFGTGYSSMTYLRHLPIDTVKIDRSFVARATEHGYDSTVIEALLTIGRTLDLSVIAEGVETEEQLEYVRARGCHRAQGYLLARPMPIDEAEAMMSTVPALGIAETGATGR